MATQNLIIYDEDFTRINAVLGKLCSDSKGKAVFLIDKNGQLIAARGDTAHIDTTSLASLTAGNIAATGGLAQLLGEREFSILFHEGEKDNLHISVVSGKVILVVIFDNRSSLGLVRLRVKKASEDLAQIFKDLATRREREAGQLRAAFHAHLAEITDEDIDNLFKS